MFNSLINLHDFVTLAEKAGDLGVRRIVAKLSGGKSDRVEETWRHTSSPPVNWWDVPRIARRWNRLITGDEEIDIYRHVTERYFGEGGLRALSLGCGAGGREYSWMKAGGIAELDAYDLSSERIAQARSLAAQHGLEHVLRFHIGDAHELELEEGSYDLIVTEGSLHHFSPVRAVAGRIDRWLKPSGLFIVNEYIGPSRFQWSDRQIEITNELLATLPEHYRRRWGNRGIKRKVYRPGRLSMYLNDPSEAAESEKIEPVLREVFDVVEAGMYGGTILHILLKDIAWNFLGDDPLTLELLQRCFDTEDRAIASGEVRSDFGFFVCRKVISP